MAWTPTTWDPATAQTSVVLSGGDLVYSTTNYYQNIAKTVASVTSGSWYWEITLNAFPVGTYGEFGARAGTEEGALQAGSDLGGLAPGDVIGLHLDADAGTMQFYVNGVAALLATGLVLGVGEVWRPEIAMQSLDETPVTATANFGASAFAYTVPVGANAGFGEDVPFAGASSAPVVLGAPRAVAYQHAGIAQASMVLGAAIVKATHDFTGALGDATIQYVMDIITSTGPLRAPISSWQATLQTDASSYVQCVVPACAPYISQINDATEFVIYRRAQLVGGSAIEYEMARAPATQVRFDKGPQRHTCTLAGYSPAFVADSAPPAAYDRDLTAIRTISSGNGGTRVRCAVDWLLRPGHRAFADGAPMVVDYINYYCPSNGDSYMDVGERA